MEKNRIIAIKIIKLFIIFLKNENLIEQYIQNSKLGITKKHTDRNDFAFYFNMATISKGLVIDKANCFISSAFTWIRTNEGHTFWCDVHLKWIAFLDKYLENLSLLGAYTENQDIKQIKKYYKKI